MRTALRSALAPLAGTVLLALGACNSQPQNIVGGPDDDQAQALANAAPVELPPAIEASKSYRCKDNSVVYVDWMAGGKQAAVRAKKTDAPTMVKAAEAGQEMTAEGGFALSGKASDATAEITVPGKDKQSCKS